MTKIVLLYHQISEQGNAPFVLSQQAFAAQIEWLTEQGFDLLPLSRYEEIAPAEKAAFITFDDGYEDVYQWAFPVLKAFDGSASVFLITEYIGRQNEWECEALAPAQHLNTAQIEDLCTHNWEMHSHTATHADYRQLPEAAIEEDVKHATQTIRLWNQGAVYCAFPYGRSEARLIQALREQGYAGAFIAQPTWPENDPFRLPRLPAQIESLEAFQRKIQELGI